MKDKNNKISSVISVFQSIRFSDGVDRLNYILIFLIILITCLKISLAGKGFLAFPDEFIYRSSERAFQNILDNNIAAALNEIFTTQGRPGEALIKIIPCAIQYFSASVFNINYAENSYPMFVFNFFIYCSILIVHYKFSKLIFKMEFFALMSVLLYCCVTNSYIYLRHVLPYDTSLLILYFALYQIIKYTNANTLSLAHSFFLGTFSFFGLIVYPGYISLFMVSILLLFFNKISFQNLKNRIHNSAIYILGGVYCLIVFELASNYIGRSYIDDTISLSQRINQGSFDESFSFILKYLFEVESISATVLVIGIISLIVICVSMIIRKERITDSSPVLLFVFLFLLFFFYASAGHFKHAAVFYGRLLHQYYPFICFFVVYALYKIPVKKALLLEHGVLILSLIFIINFAVSFNNYIKVAYPRDVAFEYNKKYDLQNKELIFEYGTSVSALPTKEELYYPGISAIGRETNKKILLVNFCYFYPAEDLTKYHEFIPAANYLLIESMPYFLNFKAYQYEGFNILERGNISKMNLQIKVYVSEIN